MNRQHSPDGAIGELRLLKERGVGVIAATAFNGGNGILVTGPDVQEPLCNYRPATVDEIARTRAIKQVCDAYQVPLAAAALQFSLRHPVVSSLVTGFGSPKELEECRAWFDCEIDEGLWADLHRQGLLHEEML